MIGKYAIPPAGDTDKECPDGPATVSNAPGGLSWSQFRAMTADVGSWAWGTAQGAFNEKASLSQILVDAVIGMIPLVGMSRPCATSSPW